MMATAKIYAGRLHRQSACWKLPTNALVFGYGCSLARIQMRSKLYGSTALGYPTTLFRPDILVQVLKEWSMFHAEVLAENLLLD